jgi:hypothetical protein
MTLMREGDLHALTWFAMLSSEEQRVWLDARRAENTERRVRECAVRGHVVEAGLVECPHCDTPYADIDRDVEVREP